MNGFAGLATLLLGAAALGGCAVGEKLGWQRTHEPPSAVVQASCDAATQTLKGGPDHATAHRACVDAKTRQHVD